MFSGAGLFYDPSMSTFEDPTVLCFPLQPTQASSSDLLIVRDLDIVGVGALRRHQLQELKRSKSFILQTHEKSIPDSVFGIYQEELLRTLQWLRPIKTQQSSSLNLSQAHKEIFSALFPKTEISLGAMAVRLRDLYLQDMTWDSWLLQDHWRYFVGFLRQKFSDNKPLIELAHWEWVQGWLEVQAFSLDSYEAGRVHVHPSLQVVPLTVKNEVLGRGPGLLALIYDDAKKALTEKALDPFEARLLDLLQEDRKYSASQLLEQAALSDEFATPLTSQEWEKRFLSLQDQSILICRD